MTYSVYSKKCHLFFSKLFLGPIVLFAIINGHQKLLHGVGQLKIYSRKRKEVSDFKSSCIVRNFFTVLLAHLLLFE